MRLFVGVEVGSSIAEAASELIEELRRRVSALAPQARVTWVPPQNVHITVRFIGHVDEGRSQVIHSALEGALDVAPFDAGIQGVGAFPGRGAPRVFWAGVADGRESLLDVEQAVSARLGDVLPEEERPYSPHLTLARVKDPAGIKTPAVFEGLTAAVLGRVHVEAITLFESRLSPKGPTYVPRQRTALRIR